MFFSRLRSLGLCVSPVFGSWVSLLEKPFWRRAIAQGLLTVTISLGCLCFLGTPIAIAGINDDNFDGNIYALYGGNGSLVPPRVSLAQSLDRDDRATILVYYLEDSSDCKQFAIVVSQIQSFYGRAADIIPWNVDAIPVKETYSPTEPGYYYEGVVPQTVVLDKSGEVVYNGVGQVPYEDVDDVLREVYDLLPRSQSVELKRRPLNEVNTELTP